MFRWLTTHTTVALHAVALTIAMALIFQSTTDRPFRLLSFHRRSLSQPVMPNRSLFVPASPQFQPPSD